MTISNQQKSAALEEFELALSKDDTMQMSVDSINTIIKSLQPTQSEEIPDKYHRHHEIHEGKCVTCYMMGHQPQMTQLTGHIDCQGVTGDKGKIG